MKKSKKSITLSLIVCFVVFAILLILVFIGPKLFELYLTSFRGINPNGAAIVMLKKVFACCFYPSALFAGVILYSLISLLFNIKKEKIFVLQNVRNLRVVSWNCFAIMLITFTGGFFYMPLMFVAAAGGFTGVLLRVLKNVMQSAVELKEENELTI